MKNGPSSRGLRKNLGLVNYGLQDTRKIALHAFKGLIHISPLCSTQAEISDTGNTERTKFRHLSLPHSLYFVLTFISEAIASYELSEEVTEITGFTDWCSISGLLP